VQRNGLEKNIIGIMAIIYSWRDNIHDFSCDGIFRFFGALDPRLREDNGEEKARMTERKKRG